MKITKRRYEFNLKADQIIEYKDLNLLRMFLSPYGKILPRRTTNLNLKQQRQLSRAVKRARMLKLIPLNSKGV